MDRLDLLAAAFFGVVFPVVGVLVVIFTLRAHRLGRASRNWVKTRGEILSSTIQKDTSGEGVSYRARIVYRYQVDDRVAPGGFPPGAPTDPNVRN